MSGEEEEMKKRVSSLLAKNWRRGGSGNVRVGVGVGGLLTKADEKKRKGRLRRALGDYVVALEKMKECEAVFREGPNAVEFERLNVLGGVGKSDGNALYDSGLSKMMHGCCVAAMLSGTSNFGKEIPRGYSPRTHGRPMCERCAAALDMSRTDGDPAAQKMVNDKVSVLCSVAGQDTVLERRVVRHVLGCNAEEIAAIMRANPSNGFAL
jgi:hypothetical protein